MAVDPRTPVIVGVDQVSRHRPDAAHPNQAVELMIEATGNALRDATAETAAVDTVGVCAGLMSHPNPAAAISQRLSLSTRRHVLTTWGGQTPIALLSHLAGEIAAGRSEVAVMVGGEANASRDAVRKAGRRIAKPTDPQPEHGEAEPWGPPLEMGSELDRERGGEHPRNNYAILHSAIRHQRGESLNEARQRIAALWAGYAEVATRNPHAADQRGLTADEIATPSPDNRMVAWPFTKAMCANNRVDQAGAVVLVSTAMADRLGIAPDQRIYLHHTVNATDTDTLLPRPSLAAVPALTVAAARLRSRWGDLNRLDYVDLYGCFPSIVALTAEEFGLDTGRPLTMTGGLGFMGAPLNFAAGQSLIAMVRRLRTDAGSYGLVQGNGGQAAKNVFAVLSTAAAPWAEPEVVSSPATPVPPADPWATGAATIDGITVEFSHAGAERAVAVVRLSDGARLWATSTDAAVIDAAISQELVGAEAGVDAGIFSL